MSDRARPSFARFRIRRGSAALRTAAENETGPQGRPRV